MSLIILTIFKFTKSQNIWKKAIFLRKKKKIHRYYFYQFVPFFFGLGVYGPDNAKKYKGKIWNGGRKKGRTNHSTRLCEYVVLQYLSSLLKNMSLEQDWVCSQSLWLYSPDYTLSLHNMRHSRVWNCGRSTWATR